jgi:glucan phosphoethanolaminetransferase (alkaline phosphatase superfamily)
MTLPRKTTRFGALQVAICVLALATAVVHIYLGVITHVMVATQPEATAAAGGATALGFFAALFYLDGLAYIVLTVALFHPALARFRRLTRWALIALTAATIIAYFALIQGHYDALGIANKINEVALIVLLVVEGRRDRTAPAPADADRYGR